MNLPLGLVGLVLGRFTSNTDELETDGRVELQDLYVLGLDVLWWIAFTVSLLGFTSCFMFSCFIFHSLSSLLFAAMFGFCIKSGLV